MQNLQVSDDHWTWHQGQIHYHHFIQVQYWCKLYTCIYKQISVVLVLFSIFLYNMMFQVHTQLWNAKYDTKKRQIILKKMFLKPSIISIQSNTLKTMQQKIQLYISNKLEQQFDDSKVFHVFKKYSASVFFCGWTTSVVNLNKIVWTQGCNPLLSIKYVVMKQCQYKMSFWIIDWFLLRVLSFQWQAVNLCHI